MKTTFYYKDIKTGKNKRYRGNVQEVDGKFFGKLVNSKTVEKKIELDREFNNENAKIETSFETYKDNQGIEHKIEGNEKIEDGFVVISYENNITCNYEKTIEEKITYLYNGKEFKGEIIEENGKYYGKL